MSEQITVHIKKQDAEFLLRNLSTFKYGKGSVKAIEKAFEDAENRKAERNRQSKELEEYYESLTPEQLEEYRAESRLWTGETTRSQLEYLYKGIEAIIEQGDCSLEELKNLLEGVNDVR